MNIEWQITQADQDCVRAIICDQGQTTLMRDRRQRNLSDNKTPVTKERLWRAIVCMRLTTQARSGPTGRLATFQSKSPFPLGYDIMKCVRGSHESFILTTLRSHKVGRHPTTISKQLTANFDRLEGGKWQIVLKQCNELIRPREREVEITVADCIEKNLDGFGSKQARNVLQALGLTRYEIPIDSRVTNWLNKKLGFPFQVSAVGLADKDVYRLVSDAICQLCQSCEEFPCILDAAIFGSQDSDVWSEGQLVY
jgi:hypothetical protein